MSEHVCNVIPYFVGLVVNSGWLWMKSTSRYPLASWQRRWVVLKDDCIAYYYSSCDVSSYLLYVILILTLCYVQAEADPLGAIVLRKYTVSKVGKDIKRENAFKLKKGGAKTYLFGADSHEDKER